ncbi:MAG: SPFH domain-containing protein [Candidatus Methylumidiphilus sp.]
MQSNAKWLLVVFMACAAGCSKVPAGNVGIKVHLLGGDKGVDTEELGPGRYWIGLNEELYIIPTYTHNYVFTKSSTEGSPENEELTFQTIEGLSVSADVGLSYNIPPHKAAAVFQKYRKGVEEITHVYLRNMIRDALVTVASDKPVEYVYGKGKAELIKQAEVLVREQVKGIGIDIEHLYWIGDLRLPPNIIAAINAKIQATQLTAQRENEIAQMQAEAQKEVAKAEGEAKAKLAIANAEAQAIKIKGEAEAAAIRAKSEALNTSPQLVQYTLATNWNGVLPVYTGGAIPLLNLPGQK